VCGNDGWVATTVIPPVLMAGTAALRRTVTPPTVATAVTSRTGGTARTMASAVVGSGAGFPREGLPRGQREEVALRTAFGEQVRLRRRGDAQHGH
jgi:hypothetical protein